MSSTMRHLFSPLPDTSFLMYFESAVALYLHDRCTTSFVGAGRPALVLHAMPKPAENDASTRKADCSG